MEPRQRTSDEGRSWYRSVYDAHATQLLAYFLRRVAEDHAHDLVAEVFLTAWRRRESAPDEPDLRPWLFKVARNVLRNHRRGTARRRQLHERLRSHAMTETAADPPPDSADISARLRWALNRLREPDREILQLAAWEECTTSELATVLGWSANAAAVRLHRARPAAAQGTRRGVSGVTRCRGDRRPPGRPKPGSQEVVRMHDADDATLMRALHDADPLRGTTLDADARQRLEGSWREAAASPAVESRTWRQTTEGHGRRLHLVAAAIAVFVVITGGVILSSLVAQRGASTQRVGTAEPDAAAVDGSYRATVQYGDEETRTIDIVDGRVHVRFDPPHRFSAPAAWRGFAGGEPVFVDEHIISGDETYMHARTGSQGRADWYRYVGPVNWDAGLTATALPVFTEDDGGFSRVQDAEAAARGLTRYSADIAAADLDFLGWFSPLSGDMNFERNQASVDIWVDASGRVHRIEEVTWAEAEFATTTRFDRFDALGAIAVPFGEGDDVPVAADVGGITLTACGDAAAGDPLRERLREVLNAEDGVASYKFLDKPTPEQDKIDDTQARPDDRLFIVAVRLRDVNFRAPDRLLNVSAGSLFGQSYADLCSVASAEWIELEG